MRTSLSLALVVSLAAASCEEKKTENAAPIPAAPSAQAPASAAAPAPPAPPPPAATAPAKAAEHVEIQMASVANTMAFDKTKLSVHTGAEVHLVIKNNATMATLPHNWVLVKKGTEAAVAAAGLKLGEAAGYVDVRDHDVLAFTPLAKPGETTDVTFFAPEAGDYPYICTFPGHYVMMKGVLTVTP